MPLPVCLASILMLASPPPMPPVIASKLSDWPSPLRTPLTGRNSPPPGSVPRSA
jgi:hypothetical protein